MQKLMLHPMLTQIWLHQTIMHATTVIAGTWVSLDAENCAASTTGNNLSASKSWKWFCDLFACINLVCYDNCCNWKHYLPVQLFTQNSTILQQEVTSEQNSKCSELNFTPGKWNFTWIFRASVIRSTALADVDVGKEKRASVKRWRRFFFS